MASGKRVAVTGAGVVAPGAIGLDAFAALLSSGKPAIEDVTRFDTSKFRARKAALVSDFRPKDFIPVMRLRRMNALSRLTVASAQMAISDASLPTRGYQRPEVGVAVGTVFGPVQTSLDYMTEYVEKGASLAPPQLFAESVANAPGSHIAIENGFEGFNLTFTQRESSVAASLMYACSQILKGTVRASLVAGVDEMNQTLFGVLDRAGALASARDGRDEAGRPFDRDRNGIVAGEGSGAFILEADPAGIPKFGWVAGFGMAHDPSASISDWGDGVEVVAQTMRRAIDDAELEIRDIDAIFASANSSVRGDRLEYRAIQSLFGERVPPVVASKAYFGEYAGGGALQIASALVAMRSQELPATPGFAAGESEMRFSPTSQHAPAQLGNILINTISAGGGVVSLVLSRNAS